MENTLVSIITPTYNHEKFIGRCIESVLAQSYPYWEMIIIDDGSTDSTGKIIEKYNDKRIKYTKQKNKGIYKLYETYNKALKKSKGKIIAILEGDDFWPDNKLEKQITVFEDSEVVLSWGMAEIPNEMNDIVGYRPKSIKWLRNRSNKELYKYLFFGNFIPACTVMCRRSSLMIINGFKQCNKFPYVDHTTWLELGLNGKICYIDQILGFWRHHEGQISAQMSVEMVQSLKYGKYFLQKITESQKKQIDLGVADLIIFNIIHFIYLILYRSEQNSNSSNNSGLNLEKRSSKSLIYNLKIFIKEILIIFKINIGWLVTLIRY
jgi:glycosyltransferase involved in cell wall biosynthesis